MNLIYRRAAHIGVLCALLSVVGVRAQAQSYVFGAASYSAPGLSAPIVTADFNGDGIPDVAILGSISAGPALSIFLGRPD